MEDTTVYDLGDVGIDPKPSPAAAPGNDPAPPVDVARTTFAPQAYAPPAESGFDLAGALSVLIPGAGHLIQRQWAAGLFFLSALGFLAAMGWAMIGTMDRLTETLAMLGQPRAFGVWTLAGIYVAAAILHLWNVLSCSSADYRDAPHPVVSGAASLLVPGLGQMLNGDAKRAALFVASLWVIGASWILATPQARTLLESLGFYLPAGLSLFSSTAVRWTLPAVVWTLSVYDAASSAASRR